ncbi:AAA family ATPase [Flavobacterium sp. MAH-1]|uniref:AAA family ATPase n=1 Tax=Flavobacterium agri TaxID=2743471 RepID=A0A7Y8Y5P7_9FLAO|nr:ATP-binding protein [Flavobacterium agri]NUY81741.1 AAA family ATPase [Flavobacterium agri]NYA71765.1 AAA family ATPase [Flavobacterium agri]
MALRKINPNSDHGYIDGMNISLPQNFTNFLTDIRLFPFRHIDELYMEFQHPISVISGTNRSGKSTILMAIACSHLNFEKRNVQNGKLERHTWSSLMHFTDHDTQSRDWTYFISYRWGTTTETKRGQRKAATNKWNGIGKKESQFSRQVVFIDLDRVMPARNFSRTLFHRARRATTSGISALNVVRIEKYMSYILEENFSIHKLANYIDKDIFSYNNSNEYSSYNAATGEEVLLKIIIDLVDAQSNSLILIDEIEIGLHPKIQRRLMDVLYHVCRTDKKQLILTSHSPSILSSVPNNARNFIQKLPNGSYQSLTNISVNACLSKMDSKAYPLFDLYCEDTEAKKIISKAISNIQRNQNISNFSDLINLIVVGDAEKTYNYYTAHKNTYPNKRIKTGYACILDGDQRATTSGGALTYPPEDTLHFIYSNHSPERFLVQAYLNQNPNTTLEYHVQNSNVHSLFTKMVEESVCISREEAFEVCWAIFFATPDGQAYFQTLQDFILEMVEKYSTEL